MSEVKSEKVQVGQKTLTVFNAQDSHVMNLQRSIAMSNAGKETPEIYDGLDEQVVAYVHNLLYPSLVSCSRGQVPSEEEFALMSDAEINAWTEPALRLNPDWFSFLSGDAEEEQEKKE